MLRIPLTALGATGSESLAYAFELPLVAADGLGSATAVISREHRPAPGLLSAAQGDERSRSLPTNEIIGVDAPE